MFTPFLNLETAQSYALEHGLRQRAVAYITRGAAESKVLRVEGFELLVFDHDTIYPTAGTQVPAGGLEDDETPLEATLREAFEETGLEGLQPRAYLGSGLFENGLLRQIWHFCWLEVAPDNCSLPDAWQHRAEEGPNGDCYAFYHRFEPLETVVLHYDMDALLPELWAAMGFTVIEKAVCFVTRANDELLVFAGHNNGGVQVPRGTLEPGESALEAGKRELFEESGLQIEHAVSLGRSAFKLARAVRDKYPPDHPKQRQVWYYHHLHFTAPPDTPDAWTHRVSAGSSDTGRLYYYSFQPLETVELANEMGVGLQALLPSGSRTPLRPCVVCYVTREKPAEGRERSANNLELLVFTGHPWGGVQVVAGGIDAGESALEAAQRELLEESGLRLEDGAYLGRHDYFVRLEGLETYETRYCYHRHVSHELPDTWVHTVSHGESDKGLEYQFYWVRVGKAKLDWELGEFLPLIESVQEGRS